MKKILPLALGGALLLVTLLAVGCSDDSDGESSDTTETVPGDDAAPPDIGGGAAALVGAESPELEVYIGLNEEEAGALADDEGRPWRVIEIDGEPQMATADYNEERLNFAITDGVVVGVRTG